MNAIPAIKTVMTAAPLSIDIREPVRKAQELMNQKRIRHLPVMDGGKVVSVLSDRDINLALIANQGLEGANQMTVEDVCTLQTYSVGTDAPLDEVVMTMAEKHIGSVLVLENGELAGIFTATDACKYLGRCLRGELK